MKIYAGYLRVSDERQIDNYSIDSQRRAIEQYVTNLGGTVSLWYTDEGKSARQIEHRDAFLQMRRDAGQGRFNVLVVHRWDRLNRNRMQSTAVKALLRKDYGIQILSATEPSEDMDGSMGGLIEGILESVSEWYSRNLSEKYVLGKQEMWLQGKYVGSSRPFGYTISEDNILVPHPEEAPIVREMYEKYRAGGWSMRKLADWLNEQGFRTTKGRMHSYYGVKEIMRNPIYKGYLKRQQSTFNANGKRTYEAPVEYRRGAHEPIVSEELWDAVATEREKNIKNRGRGGDTSNRYLLQGLVYCADCIVEIGADDNPSDAYGRCGARWGNKPRKDGSYAHLYICKRTNVPHTSRNYRASHRGADLERVHERVLTFLMDLKDLDRRQEAIDVLATVLKEKTVEQRLADVREKAKRLDYRFDQGFIVDMEQFKSDRARLQAEIDSLAPLADDSVARAQDIMDNFEQHWSACNGDLLAQRELLQMLIERVYIKDGDVSAIVLRPGQWFTLNE